NAPVAPGWIWGTFVHLGDMDDNRCRLRAKEYGCTPKPSPTRRPPVRSHRPRRSAGWREGAECTDVAAPPASRREVWSKTRPIGRVDVQTSGSCRSPPRGLNTLRQTPAARTPRVAPNHPSAMARWARGGTGSDAIGRHPGRRARTQTSDPVLGSTAHEIPELSGFTGRRSAVPFSPERNGRPPGGPRFGTVERGWRSP